jgi:hypothetical protein
MQLLHLGFWLLLTFLLENNCVALVVLQRGFSSSDKIRRYETFGGWTVTTLPGEMKYTFSCASGMLK